MRLAALVSVAVMALGCGGTGSSTSATPSDGKVYTIRYVGIQAENDPHTKAQQKFKELVEAQSKGRIQVKVFYGQQYAGGVLTDITSQTKLGVIQMADTAPATLAQYTPDMGVLAMPFLFGADDRVALAKLDGKA